MASFEKAWQCFFERRGIGVMTDGCHHGEGEHDQRNMPMPAMPGTGLVVVETEDALLITTRERSQDVGKLVKELEQKKLDKLL